MTRQHRNPSPGHDADARGRYYQLYAAKSSQTLGSFFFERVFAPGCGYFASDRFSPSLPSNVKRLIFSRRLMIAPILSRRTQHWEEKSDELAAFQLLNVNSLCYMTLRLVVNRSGGILSRLRYGGETTPCRAAGPMDTSDTLDTRSGNSSINAL